MKLTNPEIIKSITKSWKGERDKNSRPLVSENILKRMKLCGQMNKNFWKLFFCGCMLEYIFLNASIPFRFIFKINDILIYHRKIRAI